MAAASKMRRNPIGGAADATVGDRSEREANAKPIDEQVQGLLNAMCGTGAKSFQAMSVSEPRLAGRDFVPLRREPVAKWRTASSRFPPPKLSHG
jgi:hypothetical protein